VGFSVDEARAAEFVTIVGGEAAVGTVGEQVLVQAGCRVERIVGRNEAETSRLLADMARAGRRFRVLDVEF
jgi:putative cell wall-binding protein